MKIKCTVTRIDEYEIEFDENVINQEWIEDFSSYMFDVDDHEVLAKHLASMQARFGSSMDFIEGFGYVCRNGELPFSPADYSPEGKLLPPDQRRDPAEGINISIINEDDNIEVKSEIIY